MICSQRVEFGPEATEDPEASASLPVQTLRRWSRVDMDAETMHMQGNKVPNWDFVVRRVTMDTDKCSIIVDREVSSMLEKDLKAKLGGEFNLHFCFPS